MPKAPWTGYGRFCPLARGLDVVGDRWTLVIVQELMKRPSRYGELARRLPGISTTVLAERLRKLEAAGVVVRVPGAWRMNRPPRPQVNATVGSKAPSGIGTDALLDFRMEVSLDGLFRCAIGYSIAAIGVRLPKSGACSPDNGKGVDMHPNWGAISLDMPLS